MAERPPNDNPPAAPSPGTELYQGRYELGPLLGRGGTCTVNQAWDTRLHRYVAIKRLLPPLSEDEHARARFNREGRAIARLSHPNLVVLIDRGSTEREEYLVFEYVEGQSLKDRVRSSGPLPLEEALHITGQVAEGLSQAHLVGIVHRDVKPQNILLDAEGRAKLTDFGIATGADWTRVTRAGTIVGSSRYMSPEQVQSRPVDARSDIYSLGIVLYELLCGRPPFDGTNLAEIGRQHVKQKPTRPSELRADIPPELERVMLRCLEKLPENRFQSMDEFLGALIGLDYYSLERSPGGLLDGLRRRAQSIKEGATDPNLWLSSRGGEAPAAPPGADGAAAGSARRAESRQAGRGTRRAPAGRRRTLGLAAALVAGVLLLFVAGSLLLGGSAEAPDLVGKTLDEAQELAEDAGLSLEVDSEQIPSDVAGMVQEQSPAPGEETAEGLVTVRVTRAYQSVTAASLDDSDPEGDGEERPDLLEALSDGAAETSWTTELYRTESFGNLKQGVGIVFELPEAANVISVNSPDQGWTGEVQDRRDDGSFVKMADLTGGEERVVLEQAITAGRIWITSLVPGENDRFQVRISELAFLR